jgi:hypothetical protein
MTPEKKYEIIKTKIPEYCNILRGHLGPDLKENADTVGILTDDGVALLTPLMNVEPVINEYWELMEMGATFVVNAGTERFAAFRYDGVGWVKDTRVKLGVEQPVVNVSNDPNKIQLAKAGMDFSKLTI